jgi:hypothetical protein
MTAQTSTPNGSRIPRPGHSNAFLSDVEEGVTPAGAIANGVFGSAISYWELEAAALTIVEAGVLGGAETVAIFGGVLSGAGSVVLLAAGVAAVFDRDIRSHLGVISEAIGISTSAVGLSLVSSSQALGRTPAESLQVGAFGKAAFAGYGVGKALQLDAKTWKEVASAASNAHEVLEYVEHIGRNDASVDRTADRSDVSKAEGAAEPGAPGSLEPEWDPNWRMIGISKENPDGMTYARASDFSYGGDWRDGGDNSESSSDHGDPPGFGEVGGGEDDDPNDDGHDGE